MPALFSDILVPLDGSPAAERALDPACALARRVGVPLRLLSRILPGEAQERTAYLAGVAGRLAAGADVETRLVDRESIPDAIIDGLGPGTLVCISSHGRGGLVRGVMGSVTEALLRMIDRPSLVIGPHAGRPAPFDGRVVACVDGSPESERAIEPARRWAEALDRPLWLIQVRHPTRSGADLPIRDVVESGHLAVLARDAGGASGWDVLHAKSPARALADLAASEADPVALLVMATHGHTGWDRLRLGSVTTATVHAAPVPVLVVPAQVPSGTHRDPCLFPWQSA
jgi:nucleotide-binding universal stress UspA family protein